MKSCLQNVIPIIGNHHGRMDEIHAKTVQLVQRGILLPSSVN
jgi:hypothetical protein